MYFNKSQFYLTDETQTRILAESLASLVKEENLFLSGLMVYLKGDLGSGKSFFSRSFIQSFIPEQKVKSPTYTLFESYSVDEGVIQHFDLYRLDDPEELEFLAIRELLDGSFVALVEWPEKGAGVLPKADITLRLTRLNTSLADNDNARDLEILSHSLLGSQTVEKLTGKLACNLLQVNLKS